MGCLYSVPPRPLCVVYLLGPRVVDLFLLISVVYDGFMKTSLSPTRIGLIVSVLTMSVLLAGCKQVATQVQNKVAETVQQAQTALLSESDLAGIKDPDRKSVV